MLVERNWMYENIYTHPNSIGINLLRSELIFHTSKDIKFIERIQNIESFLELNDQGLLNEIKGLKNKSEEVKNLLSLSDKFSTTPSTRLSLVSIIFSITSPVFFSSD